MGLGLALVDLAGCGGEDEGGREAEQSGRPAESQAERKADERRAEARRARRRRAQRRRESRLREARCPAGSGNCRAATGPILYVEAVDPDGDGDAHFVILDRQGLSGPGITSIDVAPRLRPEPLPGVGDRVSASGPLRTGSYGQGQIEATEVHVALR